MDSADFLTSPLFSSAGFRHAFFTRRGGISTGPFESLNFSTSVGDDGAAVFENLTRAARALGVLPYRVYYLSQVHGARAFVADGSLPARAFVEQEGDAVLSRTPDLACGVRSADCVPVLLGDRTSGAVAAVHAGWRGVVRKVVHAGVEGLRALAGGEGDLIAAIGPHISLAAFETSDEIAEELGRASLDRDVVVREGDKAHVDLRRIVRAQLRELGLTDASIDDVPGCTRGNAELFYSFRRDGKRSGRHLSAIVPRAPASPVALRSHG